jgi:hypothetical protein
MATKPTTKFVVEMDLEKSTPGTHRYKEDADRDSAVIGALYVRKAAFNGSEPPQHITVTVEAT